MSSESSGHDDAEAVVLAAISKRIPASAGSIDLDTPILTLDGMESIQVMRAVAEIEDVCQVFIPDDALADAVTIRDLAALVSKLRQES